MSSSERPVPNQTETMAPYRCERCCRPSLHRQRAGLGPWLCQACFLIEHSHPARFGLPLQGLQIGEGSAE